MRTVYTILKFTISTLLLSLHIGCGGSSDNSSVGPTTTTTEHNFLFFNSCLAPCSTTTLFKHYINDGTTTPVGSGVITHVEAEYDDNNRINIVVNEKLYFTATDGVHGMELWVYDPREEETAGENPKMVADIRTGAPDATPRYFTRMGSKIYFQAFTSTEGSELWVYDTDEEVVTGQNPKIV